MGRAFTFTGSGHCGKGCVTRPRVRSSLTACGALAGAGILALSPVAAPPDTHGVRLEHRAVQLTASADMSTATLTTPPGYVAGPQSTDYSSQVTPAQLVIDSGPATQRVNDVAIAKPAASWAVSALLVGSFVVPLILAGSALLLTPAPLQPVTVVLVGPAALALLVSGLAVTVAFEVVSIPVVSVVDGILALLPLPAVSAASSATAQATAGVAPAAPGDPRLGQSAHSATSVEPFEAAAATNGSQVAAFEPAKSADMSTHAELVASSETASVTDQTLTPTTDTYSERLVSPELVSESQQVPMGTVSSTGEPTEVTDSSEAPTGSTTAVAAEPSATVPVSGASRATVRPTTPPPVVHRSLGEGGASRGLPHGGDRGDVASPSAAASEGAPKVGSSSAELSSVASSSTGS